MLKKPILITGAGGYLGSVLVPMLLEKKYSVRAVSKSFRYDTTFLSRKFDKLEIVKADLTKQDSLKNLMAGAGAVVHLASLVGEKHCIEDPALAKRVNVDLVKRVDKSRKDLPLIFLSSTHVYGNHKGKVCDETTPPKPELVYAKSKYQAELALRDAPNLIILRAASFFGYAPAVNFRMLVNDFVFQAVNNHRLEIYDDSLNRTFIHIKDVARAVVFMLENFSRLKNQTYNVGNNKLNYSKKEIADTIKSLVDFQLVIKAHSHNSDKRNFIVNYKKVERAGFKTSISFRRGIKELITKLND